MVANKPFGAVKVAVSTSFTQSDWKCDTAWKLVIDSKKTRQPVQEWV